MFWLWRQGALDNPFKFCLFGVFRGKLLFPGRLTQERLSGKFA
jgi:hypothetical protein